MSIAVWQANTLVALAGNDVFTLVVLGYAAAEAAPEVANGANDGGVKLPVYTGTPFTTRRLEMYPGKKIRVVVTVQPIAKYCDALGACAKGAPDATPLRYSCVLPEVRTAAMCVQVFKLKVPLLTVAVTPLFWVKVFAALV